MSSAPISAQDSCSSDFPSTPHRPAAASLASTFASLSVPNFRRFASGQIVANTGGWVQRIAQDWLVLTITGSATAVGVTTALQFLPTLLFGLVGGMVADRYPKRRILLCTQLGMALMAAVLASLTLSGQVRAWHVYAVAAGLGLLTALDNPTRQSFVNEMVGPEHLRNAISINSSIFQAAALIGPAISGVLIHAVGPGYAFTVNALAYAGPITALLLLRGDALATRPAAAAAPGRLGDGLRYLAARPHMLWPTVLVGVFGLFTINLPVTLAAYARSVYHSGPGGYGLLSSVVAVGSLAGCLVSARRSRTRLRGLVAIGLALAAAEMLAASAPNEWSYCLVLTVVGATTLLMQTSANSMVQLAADDAVRGRVMGVYLLVFFGSGSLGGPLVGGIDQHLGPRIGMLLAGAAPALATVAVAVKLAREGRLSASAA
ncbi:MFS transporter [Rugosimonospora acidiphila]|uniref:MFS transporter n=1 Tax=Rugosimonospora acidiphila TaxID=556531 RepID=A0ABP9S2M7_9ACTN